MGKKIRFVLFLLLSLPKTVYFNFKTLPFSQAIRIPILIGYNIKIVASKKNVIKFSNTIRPFMVRIGFGGTKQVTPKRYGIISVEKGSLVFHGQATLAAGSTIDCSGHMEIGDHFSTNRNCFVSCSKEVIIGNNVMLGWDVSIFDAIGHTVYYHNVPKDSQSPIIIGDHVWLCSKSQILKGTCIGNGSIVAWGCIATRDYKEENILIAGIPGKKIQESISWGPYIGD